MNSTSWRTIPGLILAAVMFVCGTARAQDSEKEKPVQDSKPKPKVAADIKPEALWDGRGMVPFKPLDYPKMVAATDADFMKGEDYVLGITVNGQSRAYPTRFIWWHHAVNDKVTDPTTGKETFFAVTYCSVCNTGIGYNPIVNGKPILLDFYGLYNGVVTLCDRETGSAMLQINGRFVTEPLLGIQLPTLPVLDTTWSKWKKMHPATVVMSPDTPFKKWYRPSEKPEPRGYPSFPAPYFMKSMTRGDKRLSAFDKVVGVVLPRPGAERAVDKLATESSSQRRAYPVKALQEAGGVLNDKFQDTAILVLLELDTQTANAFSPVLDGKILTFETRVTEDGKVSFFDKETGTRWSIEGKGEEGPMVGKSLARIENHLSQWYGWYAYFPETTIYGISGPPQPVDLSEKPAAPPANPPKEPGKDETGVREKKDG